MYAYICRFSFTKELQDSSLKTKTKDGIRWSTFALESWSWPVQSSHLVIKSIGRGRWGRGKLTMHRIRASELWWGQSTIKNQDCMNFNKWNIVWKETEIKTQIQSSLKNEKSRFFQIPRKANFTIEPLAAKANKESM